MLKPAFVVTHFADSPRHLDLLDRTLGALVQQSDPDWIAVIVDDNSPLDASHALLARWRDREPERIVLERTLVSGGAGAARNIAVRRAAALGADIVLFNDNDDLSHPERLARTRAAFEADRRTDFIYTGLRCIDGEDCPIPLSEVRLDMVEIIEALEADPPEGPAVFPAMAAETGCLIVPSTAAMRTDLALRFPFPGGFASEDNHTWMRMAATGARFAFLPETPLAYRIWRSEMSDLGVNGRGRRFLWEKARNDLDGFEAAARLAVEADTLAPEAVAPLARAFLERVARCVARQGENALAARLRSEAMEADLVARLPVPRVETRPAPLRVVR